MENTNEQEKGLSKLLWDYKLWWMIPIGVALTLTSIFIAVSFFTGGKGLTKPFLYLGF